MTGARVFLSYKRDHEPTKRVLDKLVPALREAGYYPLIDEDIRAGERWTAELYRWVLESPAAIVLASPEAKQSDWCQREWHVLAARAATQKARVVPVCIGLGRDDLGVLDANQAVDAEDVAAILASLEGIEPNEVSGDDFLAMHKGWLRYLFSEAPVLGREPFSLAEIYVSTECSSLTHREIKKGKNAFDESAGGRADLLDTVLARVAGPDFGDAIVIQGSAGAGKSAFTLRLAHALIEHDLDPVLVRFRDLRLAVFDRIDELLEDAIRVGPQSEAQAFPQPQGSPLDDSRLSITTTIGEATIARTVIILDGWDEVSLTADAGYRAQLTAWLPKLRQFFVDRPGPPVRLIVTGRPSLEVKESGFLRQQTPVLTLLPIQPVQLEELGTRLAKRSDWGLDATTVASLATRYQEWFAARDQSGLEMLGLPLLALLAMRTVAGWKENIDAMLASPTALYRALVDQTVTHAGKAVHELGEGTVHRGGDRLRRLLRRTAAMVSVFHDERISFTELKLRLEEDGESLEEWVDDATSDNPLHELVVNFYFKGGNKELGCEFLHKSFREYLFAEAIVETLANLCDGRSGPLEPPDRIWWQDFAEGTAWHDASRRLGRLFAPQWLTIEVRGHVFALLGPRIAEDPGRWSWMRDLLADVYGWWAEGILLRPRPRKQRGRTEWDPPFIDALVFWTMPFETNTEMFPPRLATLDSHYGHALIQLTAFVHSKLRSRGQTWRDHIDDRRPCQTVSGAERWFRPGGGGYMKSILARIEVSVQRPGGERAIGIWLEDVDLAGEILDCELLLNAQLAGSNLQRTSLGGTALERADLSSCDLRYARFHRAHAYSANFSGACLDRTVLSESDLRNANLAEAVLTPEDVSRSWFENASFVNTDLRQATPSTIAEMRKTNPLVGALLP